MSYIRWTILLKMDWSKATGRVESEGWQNHVTNLFNWFTVAAMRFSFIVGTFWKPYLHETTVHQAPNKTVTSETQQPLRFSLWHSCFLVIMHLTSYISTLCCIMLLWFWQLWHFLRLKSWQNGKIQFWVFIQNAKKKLRTSPSPSVRGQAQPSCAFRGTWSVREILSSCDSLRTSTVWEYFTRCVSWLHVP